MHVALLSWLFLVTQIMKTDMRHDIYDIPINDPSLYERNYKEG